MSAIIGIPSRSKQGNPIPFIGVSKSYIDSVIAAGAVPLIIPLSDKEDLLADLYKLTDGILLPGGEDVQPSLYGELPHHKLGETAPDRDQLETRLIEMAKADKKPVLAICRGAQILNVAMKGSLYQDLPDQKNVAGHQSQSPEGWTDLCHSIKINRGSRLFNILKSEECMVNSLHHQAVKDIAPGFCIAASSPDGVIEAIEAAGDWFAIGVQCHPETLWQEKVPQWKDLFSEFIVQANKFKHATI